MFFFSRLQQKQQTCFPKISRYCAKGSELCQTRNPWLSSSACGGVTGILFIPRVAMNRRDTVPLPHGNRLLGDQGHFWRLTWYSSSCVCMCFLPQICPRLKSISRSPPTPMCYWLKWSYVVWHSLRQHFRSFERVWRSLTEHVTPAPRLWGAKRCSRDL